MRTAAALLAVLLAAARPAASSTTLVDRAQRDYYRGYVTAAARTYERAIRAYPKNVRLYLDAAVVYRDLDRHDRARTLLSKAAELSPRDPDIFAELGWACMRSFDEKAAQDAFKAALRLDRGNRRALLGLARLRLEDGKPRAALKLLNTLKKAHPLFNLTNVYEARAQEALGNPEKAVKAYNAAFKYDWTYAELRLWLGPLYEKLKRYNSAWRQYAKVLQVSSHNAEARAGARRMRRHITRKPSEIIPPKRLKRHLPVRVAEPDEKMPVIRVGVGTTVRGTPAPKKEVAFVCSGPFEVRDPETGRSLMTGPAQKAWIARRIGGSRRYELVDHEGKRRLTFQRVIAVTPSHPHKDSLIFQRLRIADGTDWEMQGDRQLKYTVDIRTLRNRGLYLVNRVPMEDYIYGVINEEMPSSFPPEALKAQSVVARNHVLYVRKYLHRHREHHYDVCDGQHCQVYSGISGESAKGRKAVDATRGLVLVYKGQLARTPYSSTCGGHTQTSAEVEDWGIHPYLKGRKDDEKGEVDYKSPWEIDRWVKTRPKVFCRIPTAQFRWSRVIDAKGLADRIRRHDRGLGYLRRVRVLKRSHSGNVNKIRFEGTRGSYTVSQEHRIRGILGLSSVRSTQFVIETERNKDGIPTEFHIYGGGWGHAVGLCQVGSAGRARAGQDFKEILSHYYPKTNLKSLGY